MQQFFFFPFCTCLLRLIWPVPFNRSRRVTERYEVPSRMVGICSRTPTGKLGSRQTDNKSFPARLWSQIRVPGPLAQLMRWRLLAEAAEPIRFLTSCQTCKCTECTAQHRRIRLTNSPSAGGDILHHIAHVKPPPLSLSCSIVWHLWIPH